MRSDSVKLILTSKNTRNYKQHKKTIVVMNFLTNDKLLIVGAGGMIGSNMVQSALMLGLTPNICLYDIYEPGVHGVFDEYSSVPSLA